MSIHPPPAPHHASAIAAGIDLGGTKIEAQVFDARWHVLAKHRMATPGDYPSLINAIDLMFQWIDGQAPNLPVAIASAGLTNKNTGLALSSNLPTTGQDFTGDITTKVGRHIYFINDCRAFTLSEAIFGAARGQSPVVGLILGTGVGGGLVVHEKLVLGADDLSGEFGHSAAPAALVVAHELPMVECGCGRIGCIETLISGPGMVRIAKSVTGQNMTTFDLVNARETDPAAAKVWQIWCDLVAELCLSLTLTIDPKVIVLGGGLSRIKGVDADLQAALAQVQFKGFPVPDICLAEGGDASGARGGAFAAWQEQEQEQEQNNA